MKGMLVHGEDDDGLPKQDHAPRGNREIASLGIPKKVVRIGFGKQGGESTAVACDDGSDFGPRNREHREEDPFWEALGRARVSMQRHEYAPGEVSARDFWKNMQR